MYFPVSGGREICDSENKNGHVWLSVIKLEGTYMYTQPVGRGVV